MSELRGVRDFKRIEQLEAIADKLAKALKEISEEGHEDFYGGGYAAIADEALSEYQAMKGDV